LQSIHDEAKLAITKKRESKGKKGWKVVKSNELEELTVERKQRRNQGTTSWQTWKL
jgi:hypothetical protein